ncbi:hypothetical protein AVEN_57974-1 [Araneus ventricosus]|uniref:Uncharacterized protein n=1 Tax=Araneus ventricosus TaxID=182803 RepID=A0A4Y2VNL1_ARAVE|nr:hypothetical protein AVEN_57974-1 [Araneus ventricosus]
MNDSYEDINVNISEAHQFYSSFISAMDHKFLSSKHSYVPNNADVCLEEKASRKIKISHVYYPKGWLDFVTEAKKKLPKFEIIEKIISNFLSIGCFENNVTIKKLADENDIK